LVRVPIQAAILTDGGFRKYAENGRPNGITDYRDFYEGTQTHTNPAESDKPVLTG
jgi:hypothetical protein